MNTGKYKGKLIIGLAVISLIGVTSCILTYKAVRVDRVVSSFCAGFGIDCNQFERSYSLIYPDQTYGVISTTLRTSQRGDILMTFEKPNEFGQKFPEIYFVLKPLSEEIKVYSNRDIYLEIRKKYGYKAWNSNDVNWPPLMPESEANKIVNSIAAKLRLPADLILQPLKKDEKKGIWTAIWWRELNGYSYENDRVSVSIMGATGEFIEYLKTYEGSVCPTVVNISEEEALKRGWDRLVKTLPGKLRPQASELFAAKAALRIVQSNMLGRVPLPIKSKNSRLAWIVNFYFTGGIEVIESEHPTEAEWEASGMALDERVRKWHEMGKPLRSYEVRYDADTGGILGTSFVLPSFLWKLAK
jgi:hypothetical protein